MSKDRMTAYAVLLRVEENDAYSNIELNSKIRKFDPERASFVRELVYGVIKNKFYLDYILSQLVKKDADMLDSKILTALRMGLYQILFMDSVPDYAAVNETVNTAREKIKKEVGTINRILRTFIRDRKKLSFPEDIKKRGKRLVKMYSVDCSIVEMWNDQFGYDMTEEILKNSNLRPPFTVRVNETRVSGDILKKLLKTHGFEVTDTDENLPVLCIKGGDILDTTEYKNGFFSVQDRASIAAVAALRPEKNDKIADVCSAPGGKSFCAAEMMKGTGKIFAFDFYSKKVLNMEKERKRLGLTNVEIAQRDALDPDRNLLGGMDKVICDVPCTGLGVLKRKPEIKYRPIEDSASELAKKQYEILTKSALYLRCGGKLMYSTCTINKVENNSVVEEFLRNNRNFALEEERQILPASGNDGFFYCVLRKNCE